MKILWLPQDKKLLLQVSGFKYPSIKLEPCFLSPEVNRRGEKIKMKIKKAQVNEGLPHKNQIQSNESFQNSNSKLYLK